ncbi:MAG: hypothetical protein ABEJ65_12305 [bacterium]
MLPIQASSQARTAVSGKVGDSRESHETEEEANAGTDSEGTRASGSSESSSEASTQAPSSSSSDLSDNQSKSIPEQARELGDSDSVRKDAPGLARDAVSNADDTAKDVLEFLRGDGESAEVAGKATADVESGEDSDSSEETQDSTSEEKSSDSTESSDDSTKSSDDTSSSDSTDSSSDSGDTSGDSSSDSSTGDDDKTYWELQSQFDPKLYGLDPSELDNGELNENETEQVRKRASVVPNGVSGEGSFIYQDQMLSGMGEAYAIRESAEAGFEVTG